MRYASRKSALPNLRLREAIASVQQGLTCCWPARDMKHCRWRGNVPNELGPTGKGEVGVRSDAATGGSTGRGTARRADCATGMHLLGR